ncbi:phage tail protein [Pseudomonas lactis]|uniref:phage tail tape measure protein n=1 Tax=Pseudomonas TaxID=286 RepID=UPI000BB668D2|nr:MULTISPECIES: phage tail tape measure protein [Pseudomonas]MBA5960601.1 phage tail protein [Pseudomonas lactis]PRW73740.1 phage tail protein [Pseudomonas fluorescens]PRW75153.1 phage tail protein [Pseudomonas fluorescens]
MSSDLRVALRFQAHAGNSRREIEQINRDLRKAGKEGAKSLADESWKASSAITKVGQVGANSYKTIRSAMRETAKAGSGTRIEVTKTSAELKEMAIAARKAARDAKTELISADRQGVQPLRQSVDKTDTSFRRMAQNSGRSLRTLKTIAMGVRQEFDRIKGLGGSMQGQLAGLGVGIGVVSGVTGSARLDRQLIRTQQTAGMSGEQREEWRDDQWRLAKAYGIEREQVQSGFDTLVASGLSYDKAKISTEAIAQSTAVTGADSGILAKALVTGASAFDIDLAKPEAALDLLQKMVVAGRLGNAELENLSSIFPKVGADSKKAGMSLAQSLSFVETLSLIELEPDRLGTLAQSTLRAFTNNTYRENVTKTTGVDFFGKQGETRNTQDVFLDLKRKYGALKTDRDRAKFMGVVFGKMDQDTQKGVNAFMTGNRLEQFASSTGDINNAKGVIEKDLADNLSSSTAVGSRMKATLGQAIDRMARPLNKGFADLGSYLLDDLNLSGEQMLAGGAALGVGGYYAGRGAKAGAGALLNKFMGGPETLKGIAVGKVLEEATGVTSVFVTNWPAGAALGAAGGPDLPNGSSSSKGKPGGFITPWLAPMALGVTATQIGGASATATDDGRLDAAQRSKLLNDDQRSYQTSFYRNRMALADKNPDQSSDWLSSEAQRLAHHETGLTAAGLPVKDANTWAQGIANRALAAGADTFTAQQRLRDMMSQSGTSQPSTWLASQAQRLANPLSAATTPGFPGIAGNVPAPGATGANPAAQAAEDRLRSLLAQPLVIEVRTDSRMIQAEVERRTDIQMRRGG